MTRLIQINFIKTNLNKNDLNKVREYGTVFENSEYEKIKKVASVWICPNPPEHRKNTITCYRIKEETIVGDVKEDTDNYDLMTVVVVCLGGKNKKDYDGLLKMLDVLLSEETLPAEKKRTLREEFGIPMTKKLEGDVDAMCNLSKGVYDKGFDQGISQGVDKGKIESIKNLMSNSGWDIDKCMDMIDIPEDKKKVYKEAVLGMVTSV